jgi:adenylosuccinate synthase
VIGNGVVVDPVALMGEVDELAAKGIGVEGRLFVSDRAHLILPYHRMLDAAREEAKDGGAKIGTTKRGIGPAYGDKVLRTGLRMADLAEAGFSDLLRQRATEAARALRALGGALPDIDGWVREITDIAARVRPFVADTATLLNDAIRGGKSVLFEGAQGTMLDIDFGTYPFVTSSNATSGGACTGSGVPPNCIDRVIGVVKAYTTRVGEGPFPTELKDATGELLRREGGEFGATTGRPRRCGWFDAVVVRYAAMLNGVDYWAMTKLDVLDTVKTLRICVAYECEGRRITTVPANLRLLECCRPVYEEMPGWMTSTKDVTRYEDLPKNARAYVERLCEITGVKLGILSIGPKRASTLRIAI